MVFRFRFSKIFGRQYKHLPLPFPLNNDKYSYTIYGDKDEQVKMLKLIYQNYLLLPCINYNHR